MLMLIVPTCSSAGGKLKWRVIMISDFVILLMLVHTPGEGHSEIFVGKIPNCLYAAEVIERKVEKENIQNKSGYICVTKEGWAARNRYLKEPTPIQKRLMKDIQDKIPKIKPKPLTPIKRKD